MKKQMVQNLKWATAHLSRRLGAGLGARYSDTARRLAGGARGTQARRRRHGRAGAGRAGAGHAGRAGAGRAGRAGAGRAGVRGTAGWAAWARPGRVAGLMGCALGALSLF